MKISISSIIQCTSLFTLMMLSSCSSSLDPGNSSDCDQLQATSQTFLDAAILHDQDPSLENCKAYKTATEAYINLIDDCTISSGIGLQEAQETLDALDC